MVILIKLKQQIYVHVSQSWNLPAIIGNITQGSLRHSYDWRYISMVVESKSWPVWCGKGHSSHGAASLLLLCYVMCTSFWHKGSDTCQRHRFPTLPGLQPHLVSPCKKNLQAGFLSFLCVTSFSFYVRICFVLPRHTYLLFHQPSLFYPSLLRFSLGFLFLVSNQPYGTLHTIFLKKYE